MGSVEEILRVEREAAANLDAARKEADAIKRKGRDDAAAIVAGARARRSSEEAAIMADVEGRLADVEAKTQEELNARLQARRRCFDKRAPEVADWVVSQITGREQGNDGMTE